MVKGAFTLQGNVLKKKFFRDVQEAKKRAKTLAQPIFTCLDGELYEQDEVTADFSNSFSFSRLFCL